MRLNKKGFRIVFSVIIMTAILSTFAICAEKVEKYIPDAGMGNGGLTLWQTIQSGGVVMIVLGLLSVAALSLIIYYFLSMNEEKLLPKEFLERQLVLIEERRYEVAKEACGKDRNIISNVLAAGLSRRGREKLIVKEAMQDEGRRNIDDLWRKLSYLSDVAVISPMVGLLGTVLGMIQAFNVIAFQTGAVKPILLASGISKAMVTTATGLIIAIPAMIFYAYFRGRVQSLTAILENISSEVFHLITD